MRATILFSNYIHGSEVFYDALVKENNCTDLHTASRMIRKRLLFPILRIYSFQSQSFGSFWMPIFLGTLCWGSTYQHWYFPFMLNYNIQEFYAPHHFFGINIYKVRLKRKVREEQELVIGFN